MTAQNTPLTTADHPQNKSSFREIAVSRTAGGGGILVLGTFGEVVAFSELMSRSGHAVPEHLRNNTGACMAVTLLAMRLEIDPFLLAIKSYQVKAGAMIAYEAQVFSAIVNTRAPIKRRPDFEYVGEGDKLRCIVSAEMNDGSVKVYKSPELGKIPVRNSPLWKGDPEQQIGYYSIRAWARRYCPEICMGIYTPEEIQHSPRIGADRARDVTPPAEKAAAPRGMAGRLDALSRAPATAEPEARASEVEQTVDEEHEEVHAPEDFGNGAGEHDHDRETSEVHLTPREQLIDQLREQITGGATAMRAIGSLNEDERELLTDQDRAELKAFWRRQQPDGKARQPEQAEA